MPTAVLVVAEEQWAIITDSVWRGLARDLSSGTFRVVFSGRCANLSMEERVYRCSVALDPVTRPKTMEKCSRAKDGEFLQLKGAYSLEGDTLILCYDRGKWSVRPDDLAGKGRRHHRQVFNAEKDKHTRSSSICMTLCQMIRFNRCGVWYLSELTAHHRLRVPEMSEEAAFLRQLQEQPEDDETRQVYADWLEERGDPRGEYLRLEYQLFAIPRRLAQLSEKIDPAWIVATCRRRNVVLLEYLPERKINTIKIIREVTGMGLAEAKELIEGPRPAVIKECLLLDEANRIAERFKDIAKVAVEPWTKRV